MKRNSLTFFISIVIFLFLLSLIQPIHALESKHRESVLKSSISNQYNITTGSQLQWIVEVNGNDTSTFSYINLISADIVEYDSDFVTANISTELLQGEYPITNLINDFPLNSLMQFEGSVDLTKIPSQITGFVNPINSDYWDNFNQSTQANISIGNNGNYILSWDEYPLFLKYPNITGFVQGLVIVASETGLLSQAIFTVGESYNSQLYITEYRIKLANPIDILFFTEDHFDSLFSIPAFIFINIVYYVNRRWGVNKSTT